MTITEIKHFVDYTFMATKRDSGHKQGTFFTETVECNEVGYPKHNESRSMYTAIGDRRISSVFIGRSMPYVKVGATFDIMDDKIVFTVGKDDGKGNRSMVIVTTRGSITMGNYWRNTYTQEYFAEYVEYDHDYC